MEISPGLSQANFRATHSLTISGMGFASLRGLAKEAERLGLFKAASFSSVVASLARPIDVQSLPSVSDVDMFISHSWSSSKCLKMLAMCHHLNLDLAIASSVVTWAVVLLVMLLRAGSYVALLQESSALLLSTTVVLPMAVWLLAYVGCDAVRATRLWFDRACVSNATPFSKLHTLQMIPAIVASSREMLVVWDESLFSRLWCCYEMAVFVKSSQAKAMHFVPTWAPIWILSCFGIGCCGVLGYSSGGSSKWDLVTSSRSEIFWSGFTHQMAGLPVFMLLAVPFSWFCLKKVRHHRRMLQQMADFDLSSLTGRSRRECLVEAMITHGGLRLCRTRRGF